MLFNATEQEGHEHVVYYNPQTGKGECSVNNDHMHDIFLFGEEVRLDEANGHSHVLDEGLPEDKGEVTKDKDRIDDVISLYRYAMDAEKKSRDKAEEAIKFYKGEQWPDDVKKSLNDEQRSALTINLVASMIDLLSGHFRRNRTDFRYKPTENGDSKMADILFIVVKQLLNKMGYFAEEIEVFEDQIKTGRGCFHIYMDFDEDINGRLKIEHFPSDHVVFSPHLKKNGSDIDYLVKWSWHTMDELKALFPEHKEDLRQVDSIIFAHPDDVFEGEFLTDGVVDSTYMKEQDMVDKAKKVTRLLECEQREYRTVFTFVDPEGDFKFESDDIASSKVSDLKSMSSFVAIRRTVFRLRETVIGGGDLLEDRYVSHRPYNHFSVMPVYCYKYKNDYWGKIEFGKDPQRELNKRRSQIMDMLNKMSGSGWFIDDTTFEDNGAEQDFKRNSSRSGWVQKVSDIARPPLRQDPPTLPNGMVTADQMSIMAFREVTHVSPEMLGQSGGAESGIAIARKQQQGILGNEFIFDNFSHTKTLIGKIIARYVMDYYRERMARILIAAEDIETMKIGGETASSYTFEDIDKLIHTQDAMEYDVVVTESQFSATARDANLAILTFLAQSGMPIPPEFLLMFIDVAEKDKLLHAFQQQAQREAAAEDKKYQTEIDKTVIAKGGAPQPQGQQQIR